MEATERDTARAEKLHEKALAQLEKKDAAAAERLCNEALIADNTFGPAHNTLGKLYFDQGKLYLAAWEFQHAADYMPQRAEPHNNLGLVFERASQLEQAVIEFELACELDDTSPIYLGNKLRAQVALDLPPEQLAMDFQQLLLIETRPDWRRWAGNQLKVPRFIGGPPETTTHAGATMPYLAEPIEILDPSLRESLPAPDESSSETNREFDK